MKIIFIIGILSLFSLNAYAEKCEGMSACVGLYTKLTGEMLKEDVSISDEMTLAVPGTDLTNENVKAEFVSYLNKNVVTLVGGRLMAYRSGEFLIAPIYVVSKNNMPQMINKDGLVTLVYRSKNDTKKLVTTKVRNMISKKKGKTKTLPKIVELAPTKTIAVCDTFERATNMMNEIMKMDK